MKAIEKLTNQSDGYTREISYTAESRLRYYE